MNCGGMISSDCEGAHADGRTRADQYTAAETGRRRRGTTMHLGWTSPNDATRLPPRTQGPMTTETAVSTGRRIKTMELVVSDVVVETPDTVTLVYEGPFTFDYKAGQFLTIDPHQFRPLVRFIQLLEQLKKKKEPPRAYSMASAPHEKLAITVKEETWTPGDQKFPTLLSPYLVYEVKPGSTMTVSGFTGPYYLPDDIEEKTDHVVHLCAGSGSVPNFSMLKGALHDKPRLRHTFVYSNKTWDDIIFRDALTALEAAHPGRVRVVHTLTRQKDMTGLPAGVLQGRLNTETLTAIVPDHATAIFYACGPALSPWDRLAAKEKNVEPSPRFMESVHVMMRDLEVPKQRFKEEAFG
jgi:ferredoxin-NADP reductase